MLRFRHVYIKMSAFVGTILLQSSNDCKQQTVRHFIEILLANDGTMCYNTPVRNLMGL